MWIVRRILDLLVMPLGCSFLLGVAAIVVALWLGQRRTGRWNRLAVAFGIAAVMVLYLGSIRVTGIFLTHWIEQPYPMTAPESIEPVDAVMIFGGSTMFVQRGDDSFILHPGPRFEAALKLYKAGGAGAMVLSGCRTKIPGDPLNEGEHLRAEAIRLGVPEEAIVITPLVRTTGDEARAVGEIARKHGWMRIALVTDAYHLGRAMRLVANEGLEPVPFPSSGLSRPGAQPMILNWVPSVEGAWYTARSWHEILGRLVNN